MEAEFASSGMTDGNQDIRTFEAPDLTESDLAEHYAGALARALESTNYFEVIEVFADNGEVHITGRVKRDNEKQFLQKCVKEMLRIEQTKICQMLIGKRYLLRSDSVLYAWSVAVSSKRLKEATHALCNCLDALQPRREIVESPLMGSASPQSGGQTTGKKGAHPTGAAG